MTARIEVRIAAAVSTTDIPDIQWDRSLRAAYDAVAHPAPEPLEQCAWCQLDGHMVRWHVYPHPGIGGPEGVLDDLVRACFCCTWGPRGLMARAERESDAPGPIQVEHLSKAGRWSSFERTW